MTKNHLLVRLLASTVIVVGGALVIGRTLAAQESQDPKTTLRDQVLASKSCPGCDLSGVSFLKGANLKTVDLSSAKLVGAAFYGADLTNANLQGADLSNALLWFADLTNANLGGVNLSGANLTGAKGADLVTAVTTNKTTCPDGQAGPCR